jgi:hypothetical protein
MFKIDPEPGSLAGGARTMTFPVVFDDGATFRQLGTLRLSACNPKRLTLWESVTPDDLRSIADAAERFSYNVIDKACPCCTH